MLLGIAHEKGLGGAVMESEGQERAVHPHMEWGRQMALVNHSYLYPGDPE